MHVDPGGQLSRAYQATAIVARFQDSHMAHLALAKSVTFTASGSPLAGSGQSRIGGGM